MFARDWDGAAGAGKRALDASLEAGKGIKNGVFARSLSEIHAARKEPELALAWARKAVLIDETDEWSQSHLAGLLLSLGDLDGAERAARLALIHSSSSAIGHFSGIVGQIEQRRAAAA